MRRYSEARFIAFDARPVSLLGRIAGMLIGVVAFVAAVLVGAVFLAGFVGLVLISAAIVMLRAWWLRRQLAQAARANEDIDGEFTVVRTERLRADDEDARGP